MAWLFEKRDRCPRGHSLQAVDGTDARDWEAVQDRCPACEALGLQQDVLAKQEGSLHGIYLSVERRS